jgi:hypothetical protein
LIIPQERRPDPLDSILVILERRLRPCRAVRFGNRRLNKDERRILRGDAGWWVIANELVAERWTSVLKVTVRIHLMAACSCLAALSGQSPTLAGLAPLGARIDGESARQATICLT